MKRAQETETEKQSRIENVREYKKEKKDAQLESGQETPVEMQSSHLTSANQIRNQQDYLNKFDIKKTGSIHQQSWAKFNINKFHKSTQFFITQCTICQEAWPFKI
jgi:hypothetical protein